MILSQFKYDPQDGWKDITHGTHTASGQSLVLAFGARALLENEKTFHEIRRRFPAAVILAASTAGEIMNDEVWDNTLALTAISFSKTTIRHALVNIRDCGDSLQAGKMLAAAVPHQDLKYALVISDGQKVNGSDLVNGLASSFPEEVIVTGGLAGDGTSFSRTVVGLNSIPSEGNIAMIGLYGAIDVGFGSMGGWSAFGPERKVTRSEKNILYELDGKPALDIYKHYLGEYAKDLPGSALFFPLSLRGDSPDKPVVRTILGIDEAEKSLRFAGNMPQGSFARLMKANMDSLIEGAARAGTESISEKKNPELALLISCVGRRLVLDQRIEEEIEVIRQLCGPKTVITGFYSYGEIAPGRNFVPCQLHNQTMTVTTLSEG
jgi:hypothetical protein